MIHEKQVYISIVNYNNANQTINCIKSVLKLNYDNYKIVLIDNNSSDNSIECLENWLAEQSISFSYKIPFSNNNIVTIIKSNFNGGYAFGNNIAIKYIFECNPLSYIWVLNNDTMVENNSLKSLTDSFNSSSLQILGCKIMYSDTNFVESFGGRINKIFLSAYNCQKHDANINYIPGTSFFFNKAVIDEIGFLPEEYFMYYEDVDWCTRAIKNGISLLIDDNAIIKHYNNNKLTFSLKLISFKNRYLYCYNHYPAYLFIQILLTPLYIIKKLVFK